MGAAKGMLLMLVATDGARLHQEMMLALGKADSTEGIANWSIGLIFRAWQCLAEGLDKCPERLVSVCFLTTTLVPELCHGPQ